MRAVYFFISLFFLLVGGGQNACAAMQHKALHKTAHHDLTRNHHNKFTEKNPDSTIIEDSDFDLDDESFSVSNTKADANKFFICKDSLPYKQQLTCRYFNDYFTQLKNCSVANGLSSPIYIVNRVLRI